MKIQLEYIINSKGKCKFVILPLRQWELIKKDYDKLKNKTETLKGLQNALEEVKQIQKGRKRGQSFKKILAKL